MVSRRMSVRQHIRMVRWGLLDEIEHIWAQDLLADEATDIIDRVLIKGNTLTIPGELIDQVGTSAGDAGDISAPGMVLQLVGRSLPVAGEDYEPKTKPLSAKPFVRKQVVGYKGTANMIKDAYGYRIRSTGGPQVVLKKLDKPIDTGVVTITWKMKPANDAKTRNGFLVLSSDEDATASVLTGAWIGAGKITAFENTGKWDGPAKTFSAGRELICRLVIDMDARTLQLNINGVDMEHAFSEVVTSINYIGFGVRNAKTLFTEPEIN